MFLKVIFTWWNKQTLGTFLKTLFTGSYVGKDSFGNKYYKNKKDERWVIYSNKVEATKITSEWYLWMHHTIDKIPDDKDKQKFSWQKEHAENKTGTENSYKPTKIKKDDSQKNIKIGKKDRILSFILLIIFLNISTKIFSEEKISSSPLINMDQIKPSFEEVEDQGESTYLNQNIKQKEKKDLAVNSSHAVLIGLDKITAKSSQIIVSLKEPQKFGPLEIKILKCGKIKVNNKVDDVAYMQVKDLSKNENEKVFIFNGWTFSSDPSLTPFDHAIYDLQLLNCYNI